MCFKNEMLILPGMFRYVYTKSTEYIKSIRLSAFIHMKWSDIPFLIHGVYYVSPL